jgi:hypothetical protein
MPFLSTRIPRPNDGLAFRLQLSQLQVEVKQVGQHVILAAPAVGLEDQGIKGAGLVAAGLPEGMYRH